MTCPKDGAVALKKRDVALKSCTKNYLLYLTVRGLWPLTPSVKE